MHCWAHCRVLHQGKGIAVPQSHSTCPMSVRSTSIKMLPPIYKHTVSSHFETVIAKCSRTCCRRHWNHFRCLSRRWLMDIHEWVTSWYEIRKSDITRLRRHSRRVASSYLVDSPKVNRRRKQIRSTTYFHLEWRWVRLSLNPHIGANIPRNKFHIVCAKSDAWELLLKPTFAVAPPKLSVTILPLAWHCWISEAMKEQSARSVPGKLFPPALQIYTEKIT